mmetsp:Transcript_9442/g.24467  ORF Transcript_9442/g.24467 Transcript_9442/m.24467 type:complete len:166 (+) Transcript_9442:31-528(+)|eukprot:CAMPEP_0119406114 /NCGR_PEP_ID=MMETSP1335-20130426/566_1 /TAXON_ID=259385 /ORGANISM="Chrysoculter rhomboideus, Strain RCC1486" /LENGTH=165 /DNA_ID=CAMNT_0007430173 /DNA_START=33 /DNA_END=530 /DNA_ORIENTATION=+
MTAATTVLAAALLVGTAVSWSPRATPLTRSRTLAAARATVRADDSPDSGADELSRELNDQLLRMPRIMDAKRVSFEAYRKRKQEQTEQAMGSAVGRVDNVEIPLDSDPKGAPPEPVSMDELAAMPAIAFDEEIIIGYDEEDEEEGQDVDLVNDDFEAADDYLNSL